MEPEHVNQNDEQPKLLALQEAERQLDLCLAGVGLGIWTYNIATEAFWANDRAKRLHGHEPHEVRTFAEAGANIHPDDRDRTQAAIAQAIQDRSNLQIEYRVLWKDGSVHWIASQAEFVPAGGPDGGMFYGSVQDISDRLQIEGDRLRVEDNRKRHEAHLASDLAGMQRLHNLHTRLSNETDLQAALAEILVTACEFTHTDRGCVQLMSDDGHRLEMFAWRGYNNDSLFIEHFRYEGSKVACDVARRHRERLVIEDLENFPPLAGSRDREVALSEHIRATQSTPLLTRQGKMVGVLSNQFSKPHRPTDHELRLIDLLAWIAADFIARHSVEQALRVSEEKYRSLFNLMDEAYAVVEVIPNEKGGWSDFRFLEVNPAFVKHTSMEHPVGRTSTQILGTSNLQWAAICGQVAETGEAVRLEMTEPTLNRTFDLNVFQLGDPKSRHVAVLLTDITERKRVEADRKRTEEAMRAFFSNVSHEFRTPLTLLLSSIQETLSDSAHLLNAAQRSQLELAHRNVVRLLKLVNTLLDISRVEAGHVQPVYEPINLATLTAELASSFDSTATQAGLQLVIDCPSLPQPVYVDRAMWEKIVLNLLSNAFKFTFAGEIRVSLQWEERQEAEGRGQKVNEQSKPQAAVLNTQHSFSTAVLEVRDTGIGIAAAELPRLFERFYQVQGTRGRSVEGSGIGLSLVQELVKLHGGTIEVSSVEGEGSCFTVSIPTGFAHLPSEQIGSPRTGGFSQDASGQLENSLQNPPLHSTATEASAYVEEALGWLPEEGSGEWGMGNGEWGKNCLDSRLPTPDSLNPPYSARG